MSVAEDQGSAAPAAVAEGPTIITVMGQDEHVAEEGAKPAPEAKAAGSEEQADKVNRDEKGRYKPGVQDRIDDLTRARREAEREAEYWRARATGSPNKAPAEAAGPPKAPVRANFDTDEAFMSALTDHRVEQKLAERDQKQAQTQAQVSKADSWQAKLAEARIDIPGFDEAMNSNTAPVAAHVAELIMESDHGAKIAHHFANNPEELEKLNEMSPAKVALALGRLETKFDKAPDAASSSKPAAQVSKAPPPAARNVGAGRATAPELGDLSMDDYVAARKAQGASWAR